MFFGTLTYAADPAQYGTPFSGVPDPRDANIYQVNAREYDAANRTFAGVTAKLDNIKALGINVIYLMPIYPIGTTKGSGSPYSISNFIGIASDLGTLTDLRALVDGAHSRGMAVILDWVVNQTSWDHAWITAHKDWYLQDGSGNILSPTPDGSFFFTDCAALNFANTAMRTEMVNEMRYWIFAANIDGYRCDWADNPPQDFWTNSIANLRGITTHKILMLAEGSNEGTSTGCTTCGQNQPGYHYSEGFDFIFGESFYWNFMKKVYNSGESAVTDLTGVTTGEYSGAGAAQMVARYLSNHDEYGSDGSPFSWLSGGRNAVMSVFVIGTYYRGVPFIYNGIEVGNTSALTYPWSSQSINWTQDLTVLTEMKKILNFRNASTALRRGTPTSYSTADVVAFTKLNGTEKVAVMVNTRNATKTFTIPSGMAGTYVDAYTNASVTLTSGANQSLNAFQYIVLTNASVPVVNVTGVTVSPTSASIKAGLTQQLSAVIAPSNATDQSVTWTSSNTAIALVNSTGLVTGVAAGSATITVKTTNGAKTATCAITVTAASNFTVYFYKPSAWGTAIKIYWWSAVPTGILADGVWPGAAMTSVGSNWYSYTFTNITSTNLIFNDGTSQTADLNRAGTGWYMGTTWYNTQPALVAVTGVTVSPTSGTIATGATIQLTPTVSPTNANDKTVSWTSSNTGIASVSTSGLVTGVGGGSAVITVKTTDGGKTATSTITVTAPVKTYYAIKNRWKGTYLYDAGANVAYGTSIANNNYLWDKQTIDATYFWLKNAGTGEYMHVENQTGYVQCTAADITWWSSQWSADYIDGTWIRIRNRWITGDVIHVEDQNGYAEYANEQDAWFSAQWQLVPTALKSAEIENGSSDAIVSMDIFPNPVTNGFVTIDLQNTANESTVQFFDLLGRDVFNSKLTDLQNTLNISSLNYGTYIVKISSSMGTYTKKLLVK